MLNLFDNISLKNKETLLKEFQTTTLNFNKGQSIIDYIDKSKEIIVIESGYLQLLKIDYNGKKILIDEFLDNDLFSNNIFSFTDKEYELISKENTKLILIDYNSIINYKKANNPSYQQFLKNLLQRIMNLTSDKNERIQILTKSSIRDKLLEYFKINSSKTGSKHIYLPFSISELADYLAVNRSAMSRELKYLKDEGFIEMKNKKITLKF